MRDPLRSGLVPLHILYHAAKGEIFGQEMLEELRHHGYRVGPGTLYPMLHRLEQRGLLKSREERVGRSRRKLYRATPKGRASLRAIEPLVRELYDELIRHR